MALQTDPQTKVRLPPDLDTWVKVSAKANKRSKTAEIEFRLQTAREAERSAAGEAGKHNPAA